MSDTADRLRRRCSVASTSDGYYTEYDDNKIKSKPELQTPSKQVEPQIDDQLLSPSRRSSRKSVPSTKYSKDFEITSPHSKQRTPRKAKEELDSGDSDNNAAQAEALSEIATGGVHNFLEDFVDVEGKQVYGFNTPKKRNAMTEKALNTPKTSKSLAANPKTPKSSKSSRRDNENLDPKTPRHVRNRIRSEILKRAVDSSGSELSADESDDDKKSGKTGRSDSKKAKGASLLAENDEFGVDFSADESDEWHESQGTSSESASADEESSEENSQDAQRPSASIPTSGSVTTRRRTTNRNLNDFIPESDEYFTSHSSKKIVTSDHTLSRLKTPRLGHSQLFSLLASMKLSSEHERCIASLLEDYKTYFNKWIRVLDEGFNILLYGLGSKRRLLQTFHSEMLRDQPVIVVNGFFPSLTIKDILDGISHEILDITSTTGNLHEIVDSIEIEFAKIRQTHLFLIVHNIDGTMLRNSKAQEVLSRLANIRNVHLIASIDHLNAPLLWDNLKLSNYNFSWWDVTTMLPYTDETSFENSLLVQNSGDLALSSMNNVFQSLTTNARKIYMLIVDQQLKNKSDSSYQGIPFKDLYWLSRESFLVSSDLALRAQLTEFLDHKLVKAKRTADGTEHLKIPIASNLLQQFVEQQKGSA